MHILWKVPFFWMTTSKTNGRRKRVSLAVKWGEVALSKTARVCKIQMEQLLVLWKILSFRLRRQHLCLWSLNFCTISWIQACLWRREKWQLQKEKQGFRWVQRRKNENVRFLKVLTCLFFDCPQRLYFCVRAMLSQKVFSVRRLGKQNVRHTLAVDWFPTSASFAFSSSVFVEPKATLKNFLVWTSSVPVFKKIGKKKRHHPWWKGLKIMVFLLFQRICCSGEQLFTFLQKFVLLSAWNKKRLPNQIQGFIDIFSTWKGIQLSCFKSLNGLLIL